MIIDSKDPIVFQDFILTNKFNIDKNNQLVVINPLDNTENKVYKGQIYNMGVAYLTKSGIMRLVSQNGMIIKKRDIN